jgi:hypothetical protein
MKFEVVMRRGGYQAWLHSVDSSCHGSVTGEQLRSLAADLLKMADGLLPKAHIEIPWEPDPMDR